MGRDSFSLYVHVEEVYTDDCISAWNEYQEEQEAIGRENVEIVDKFLKELTAAYHRCPSLVEHDIIEGWSDMSIRIKTYLQDKFKIAAPRQLFIFIAGIAYAA